MDFAKDVINQELSVPSCGSLFTKFRRSVSNTSGMSLLGYAIKFLEGLTMDLSDGITLQHVRS